MTLLAYGRLRLEVPRRDKRPLSYDLTLTADEVAALVRALVSQEGAHDG